MQTFYRYKGYAGRGLEDKRDLHLCYACSLWIHSHISPHPQYQFLYEAACTVPKRSDIDNINIIIFSALQKLVFCGFRELTCSSCRDFPDSCNGGNFSPK